MLPHKMPQQHVCLFSTLSETKVERTAPGSCLLCLHLKSGPSCCTGNSCNYNRNKSTYPNCFHWIHLGAIASPSHFGDYILGLTPHQLPLLYPRLWSLFMKHIWLRQIHLGWVVGGFFDGSDFSYISFLNWLSICSHSLVLAQDMNRNRHSRAGEGELDHIIFNFCELQLLQKQSLRAVAVGEGVEQAHTCITISKYIIWPLI